MTDETPAATFLTKIVRTFEKKPAALIPIILILGAIVRIIFLPNKGFEADISFWKSWGLAVIDHNVVWGIENTNNNYPTAFSYVLGAMAWVYGLFADPHNFQEFWNNNNLLFLTISKLPSILADFGIVFLILSFGKLAGKNGKNGNAKTFPNLPYGVYVLFAALYLLSPISIIDGAWWGQVDSLGVFIFLLALYAGVKGKPFLSGLIYMAAMMTKLQNMIYGPVFFILIWQLSGFRGLVNSLMGAVTGFLGFNIEFLLARKMNLVFQQLTVNYDYFPYLSLNSYNLWWIVAKGNGMSILDKFSTIGMSNAKSIGLYLFSSFYLLAVVIMLKDTVWGMVKNGLKNAIPEDPKNIMYRFFTAMMVVASAFFLFQTESHDRYAFPISVFLLLWGLYFLWTSLTEKDRVRIFHSKALVLFCAWYVLFSIIYFYNLHNALVDNYPQNGLPLLRDLNIIPLTVGFSFIQLGLFAAFLFIMVRHIPPFILLVPSAAFAFLIFASNYSLIAKKPVYLTKFFPIISRQDFLKRQTDMSVNSSLGIKEWNPLSVQYAFYKKGIGTHAKSMHQYHINGLFKKFSVDYGIDTESGTKSSATFEIYGDRKQLFVSEIMGRFDMPRHVEVDVTGVKFLDLVTNDGGDGVNDDHTNWLNPLLYP